MAVITISRQVAALGDEIATEYAKRSGYRFIDRKQIEKRIIELGFPQSKMPKYDERKPGFFASIVKDRDEYLNYLQYAVLEAAYTDNCILIGRGAFIILEGIENLVPLRFISNDEIRLQRLQNEFSWNEKQAQNRIDESDENRRGFHKSFFNLENEDPQFYLATLNTGMLSVDDAVNVIDTLVKSAVNSEKEEKGHQRLGMMLKAQGLMNKLLFEEKINVNFLNATVNEDCSVITLHGVTNSQGIVEKISTLSKKLLPDCKVETQISVAQNYNNYQ